jgi:1-acyl-sn-glycerol-3-phosphate acyltransferase
VIDEVMYELMRLSGQEYVDIYAAAFKEGGDKAVSTTARIPTAAAG